MSRKIARELAVQLLYQVEIQKDDVKEQIETFLEDNALSDNDKEYFLSAVNGTLENIDDINKLIESNSKNWSINRIAKVDLSILRLAIFELTKRTDIPQNVSINEAIELAKKFGTDESKAFINGILAEIVKENE